jgi:cytochrome c oxidase subunit 2
VPDGRLRRILLALPLALLVALLAAPAARAGLLFPDAGGSPNADSIKTLYIMVFVLALFIFAGVEGTLIWALVKFRARKGRTAAQIHGNTKLEIGWTVGAAVILVFITAFTFIKLGDIKDPKRSIVDENGNPTALADGVQLASTDIKAVDWRYSYPGRDRLLVYSDLVVPVGMTVILDIQADDVAHSWWIPKLGGKMDALPGYTNRTWFQIPPDAIAEGQNQVIYTGQCAELCGRNHANMYARVIGMRMPDYRRWYADQVRELKDAQNRVAQQQQKLTENQESADR